MKVIEAGPFKVLDFPPKQPEWDFWPMWEDGRWEPGTHEIVEEYAKGRRCVDIGAWVGPVTLWMAQAGAVDVRAFEPDPVAFGVLRTNMLLNNLPCLVQLADEAVTGDWARTDLTSLDFGESESGIQPGHKIRVPSLPVERACLNAEFVKVDIEGAEYGLLPELAKVGCPMLISLHPPWWPAQDPDFSGWSEVIEVEGGGGFGEVLCIP
jgi:FkbM family methyltransferase